MELPLIEVGVLEVDKGFDRHALIWSVSFFVDRGSNIVHRIWGDRRLRCCIDYVDHKKRRGLHA